MVALGRMSYYGHDEDCEADFGEYGRQESPCRCAERAQTDESWRDEECFRASGEVICDICEKPYWKHTQVAKRDCPTLVRVCDGRLLKL